MSVRAAFERGFERWARAIYRRPVPVLVAVVAGVAALAWQLPNLRFETALEEFLHASDPLRAEYDAFRRQFGRDDLLMLGIETSDVFSAASLERLRALHRDLEAEVPHLEEVTSLVNARETRGEADRLVVGELLERWPDSEAERGSVRERALANRMYRNLLLAEDGGLTVITIETDAFSGELDSDAALAGFETDDAPSSSRRFLTGEQNRETVLAVERVVGRHQAEDFRVWIVGAPALTVFLQESMQRDMLRFTGLAVVIIAFGLAVSFRRLAGVVLPLSIVILSVLATGGGLAVSGLPVALPSSILPSFLLAVGVGYSVHLLAIFFQRVRAGADAEQAIVGALGHSGLAVALTALTTAGALASFSTSPLAPIASLGYAAPAGVLFAFALSVTLLPALIALLPLRAGAGPARAGPGPTQRALARCGRFGVRRAWSVLLVSLGLIAASLLCASQLRFGHDPLSWLPEQSSFRRGTELTNQRLGGSVFLEVLLDSGAENGLHDPGLLARLDGFRREVESLEQDGIHAGKTLSIVDVLKEIHRALHGNDPAAYRLPEQRALVAQELLLFEASGSDDLEDVADARFQVGRFTLKTPFTDAIHYPGYLRTVGDLAREVLGAPVAVRTTGLLVILSGTIDALIRSLVSSYAIAFLVIAALMIALLGNVRLGLLSMLPNLAPVVLTLGIMGLLGIPLDAFTLLIGSIAIGLAVDDTIHFMHHFRRYHEQTGDVERSVELTMHSAGQAMLFTTLILCSGFLIFTFAGMNNLFHFGLLTALTIAAALVSDLLLAPAIVTLFARRRR